MVVLLVSGGHVPPLTQLRTGIAQIDRCAGSSSEGFIGDAACRRHCRAADCRELPVPADRPPAEHNRADDQHSDDNQQGSTPNSQPFGA
jgi:hypothetical protein